MGYPIRFGKYLLLERINVGGMAEVFKAKAFGVQGFERLLAIKRILPNMAEDDEFINMFVDEARIAVQLSHSNVVQIYELGKFNESYYIAMEYILGRDLRQIFDRFRKAERTFPIPAAAFVASKICDGLDYAHRKNDPTGAPLNLIHRDVSPQNILVSYEGAVKITDFGIAKAEDRASKTQAGVLKGKFGYMSPEQVRGMDIDRRSDIFALGILLYEMVTGERLFLGESDFSTLEKVRAAEVPSPTEYNSEIPEELERILLKTLARDRDERYQWASELHDDLQRFLIVDHTIYNAKNLSALLREEYQEDIEEEMRKAEDFMRIGAKEAQIEPEVSMHEPSGTAPSQVAPAPAWQVPPEDNDKTMIFEAFADFASAETTVAPSLSEMMAAGPSTASQVVSPDGPPTGVGMRPEPSEVPHPAQTSRPASTRRPLPKKSNLGPVIIGVTLMLCAAIIAGAWYLTPSENVGSIFVTSVPVKDIRVFLDGELIGKTTPISRNDIPLGEHMITGKAEGFADKVYSFLLAPGQPAHIEFRMEQIAPSAPEATLDGVIQVVSEPAGAYVRVNGVSRGETPLTISQLDRSKLVLLELAKAGHETKNLEIRFDSNEFKKLIEASLESTGPTSKPIAKREVQDTGLLVIHSNPTKATVYVDGVRQGQTPLRLAGLRRGESATIEIVKAGYDKFTRSVTWDSQDSLKVQANLERSVAVVKNQPKPKPKVNPMPPPPKPPKSRPVASSGGCSGSGARLSVMPVGVPDCAVTIGGQSLGVAPFFKKAAPTGMCKIVVTCADGRAYQATRKLGSGASVKLIIKPGDW